MPQAAALARRVTKEARILVARANSTIAALQARDAKRDEPREQAKQRVAELRAAAREVEAALAADHAIALRRALPTLDALIDDVEPGDLPSAGAEYFESVTVAVVIALLLRFFVLEAFKIPSSSMYPTLEIGDHIFVNKILYGARLPFVGTHLFSTRGPKRGEVAVFMQPCDGRDFIKRIVALPGDTVEVRCDVVYVNGKKLPRSEITGTCEYEDRLEGAGWQKRPCRRFEEANGEHTYAIYQDPTRPSGTNDFPSEFRAAPKCPAGVHGDSAPQAIGQIVVTATTANTCEPQAHFVVPPGHVFAMGDNRDNSLDSRVWGPVPIENVKGKAMIIWLSYKDFDWADLLGVTGWRQFRPARMGNFVHP